MAIDTFNYCTQVQNGGGSFTNASNVRSVSFGNGYKQIGSGGYNTNVRTYNMTYTNTNWKEVLDFCFTHIITPFAWTTPQGEIKLFVVSQDSISVTPVSKVIQTVSMQFVEVFSSMR
ncbi:minor tail protein [Escherichia phage DTL]|uniref:Putative minor tail protein n=1 Tax=Escherichia phage DTL TaxID=2048061 RepID=A0A2H4PGP1_9CAUD|nr:minor tail protein [Escherichia phage DTL]ATW61817.1 putative minor tail protein [Escherichia phage DTL]